MTDTTETAAAPAAPETTAAPEQTITQAEQQPTTPAPADAEPTADQAENASEEAAAPENENDETPEDAKPKKNKGGFQKRISELTTERNEIARQKHEALIRAQQAESRLAELNKSTGLTHDADPGSEPKIDSGVYATVEEFTKAHAEWAERRGYQKAKQESEQRQQEQETLTVRAKIMAREEEAVRKHPDYLSTISPVAPIIMNTPVLKQFVIESDMGTEVAYHLAKNPAILDQMTRMTPFQAGRELLKLEDKLSAPPPPKPVTNAPPPIKPVGPSEKAPFSLERADMDEFVKKRNEAERKARKG